MDFIRKISNKKLILLITIFGVLFISLAIFIYLNKDEKDDKTAHEHEDEHHHSSYVIDEDPYEKSEDNKDGAEVKEFNVGVNTFSNLNLLKNQIESKYKPSLIGSTENYLYFLTANNLVYLYDLENETTELIADNVKDIFLDESEEFLFFTKEGNDNDGLFSYDIASGGFHMGQFYASNYFDKIEKVLYNDEVIYIEYISNLDPGKPEYVTRFEYFSLKPGRAHENLINDFDNEYYHDNKNIVSKLINGKYMIVNKSTNSFSNLKTSSNTLNNYLKLPFKLPENESIMDFDLLKNNEFYIITHNEEELANYIYTSKGSLIKDRFTKVYKADWFDENLLVVLDSNSLYLYNIKDDSVEVLKNDVDNFVIKDKRVYITDTKFVTSYIDLLK